MVQRGCFMIRSQDGQEGAKRSFAMFFTDRRSMARLSHNLLFNR